jgi:hypothetical protein
MTIDTSRKAVDKAWDEAAEARITDIERDRDAALAQVAALREALQDLYDEQNGPPLLRRAGDWHLAIQRTVAVLTSTEANALFDNAAAKARDAALVERGQREGIEAAMKALAIDVHKEAEEYTFRGEGDHTPTEAERTMLEDFGNELIGKLDEIICALATPPDGGSR